MAAVGTSMRGVTASADGKCRRLAVVCVGTQGDLQQYIALAAGLQTLGGFRVMLVTHNTYADLARGAGLDFFGIKGDFGALLRLSALREAVASNSTLRIASLFKAETDAHVRENLPLIHAALRNVDGIVCSIGVLTECLAIGQRYQRPVILAPLLPYSPSGELPLAHLLPQPSTYAWLNKLSYDLSAVALWAAFGSTYNAFRTQVLKIGPQAALELQGVPQVTAFSPVVVPRPADWGPHVRMSGYWALPTDEAALAALAARQPRLVALASAAAHLEPAKRPIAVSFEGVPLPDPVAFLRALYACATAAGVSAVWLIGEADISSVRSSPRIADLEQLLFEVPGTPTGPPSAAGGAAAGGGGAGTPRVIVAATAPYGWLFKACSVAVHHGGAAVSQAALTAGIPSVPFPALADQFFWAARLSALGAAPPASFPLKEAEARLQECVTIARQPQFVAAAAALGRAAQATGDGVPLAVAEIRSVLSRPQHRHCGVTCEWEPDSAHTACTTCGKDFTLLLRRRHCRSCGRLSCAVCLKARCHLPGYPEDAPQITCVRCLDYRRAFFAMHVGEAVVPDLTPAGEAALAAVDAHAGGTAAASGAGASAGGGVAAAAAAAGADVALASPSRPASSASSSTAGTPFGTPARAGAAGAFSPAPVQGTPGSFGLGTPTRGARAPAPAAATPGADFAAVDLLMPAPPASASRGAAGAPELRPSVTLPPEDIAGSAAAGGGGATAEEGAVSPPSTALPAVPEYAPVSASAAALVDEALFGSPAPSAAAAGASVEL